MYINQRKSKNLKFWCELYDLVLKFILNNKISYFSVTIYRLFIVLLDWYIVCEKLYEIKTSAQTVMLNCNGLTR